MLIARRAILGVIAGATVLRVLTAGAHGYKAGEIAVGHPWALMTLDNDGAAFLPIVNRGSPDGLIRASSPIAQSVEFREIDGRLVDAFELPQGGTLAMRPGGRHLALRGLGRPLALGDRFELTLRFRQAGRIPVEVHVENQPGD